MIQCRKQFKQFNFFQSKFLGKTGIVKFDNRGERSDIELEICQIFPHSGGTSMRVVGTWNLQNGLMWKGRHEGSLDLGMNQRFFEDFQKKSRILIPEHS